MALFAGLTASLTLTERHLTALRAVIYATIILVVAMTAGQVIETHSLPTLTRSYPRHFTFYVAEPLSSIRTTVAV